MYKFKYKTQVRTTSVFLLALSLLLTNTTLVLAQEQEVFSEEPLTEEVIFYDQDGNEILYEDMTLEQRAEFDELSLIEGDSEAARVYLNQDSVPGSVRCFDYYDFGSVVASLAAIHDMSVPGATVYFSGNIENQNNYPVVDASVYVKIFKIRDAEDPNWMNYGDDVVWQGFIQENIDLTAKQSKDISWEWEVPYSIGSGEYRMATFVQTNHSYNMSGLTFTDDVTGPDSYFTISGIEDPIVWQKDSVTLNESEHHIVSPIPAFGQNEDVQFKATLLNPDDEKREVTVSARVYKWDALSEDNQRATETVGTYTVPAGETKEVTFAIPHVADSVTYAEVIATDGDSTSILNIRFSREGYDWPRLNFPALLDWPLTAGEETSYFACLHNAQEGDVEDATVTLTLTDPDTDTVLDEYRYTGVVTSAMMAIKSSFTPDYTPSRVLLSAQIEHNGEIVDSAEILYDCAVIDSLSCPEETVGVSMDKLDNQLLIMVASIVLILLIAIIVWRLIVSRSAALSLLLLAVFGGSFLVTTPVEAWVDKTTSWSHEDWYGFKREEDDDGNRPAGYAVTVNTTVVQRARAERQGSLTEGDTVKFSIPCRNSDISWFSSGGRWDSPYGDCVSSFFYPTLSESSNIDVQFLKPSYSISGSGSMSCSGTTCRATKAGSGSVKVTFNSTSVRSYVDLSRSWIRYDNPRRSQTSTVPARSVTFSYSVAAKNTSPNRPSLTCPSSLETGQSGNFSVQGTDPDGDRVRYHIDWLNNGSYVLSPSNGSYVNSGSTRTESYRWNNAGTYTVRARTQDQNGAVSGWRSCSVTVTDPPPAPAVSLSASDTSIIYGGSTNLNWSVSNVTTCSASGGWSGNKSVSGGSQSTGALTSSTVYYLTCNGAGGTARDSATVNVQTGTGSSLTVDEGYIVRNGSTITLRWNVGTSEPSTCSLKKGNNTILASLTAAGTHEDSVRGESEYTLDCPGNEANALVKVLPEFQES